MMAHVSPNRPSTQMSACAEHVPQTSGIQTSDLKQHNHIVANGKDRRKWCIHPNVSTDELLRAAKSFQNLKRSSALFLNILSHIRENNM